jgi:hypothetical protein
MIIPLEQQVTSRDISEELKKRGVPQTALFCHAFWNGQIKIFYKDLLYEYTDIVYLCDAYTVSEIVNMLQKNSYLNGYKFEISDLTPDNMAENLLRCIDSGYIKPWDL